MTEAHQGPTQRFCYVFPHDDDLGWDCGACQQSMQDSPDGLTWMCKTPSCPNLNVWLMPVLHRRHKAVGWKVDPAKLVKP